MNNSSLIDPVLKKLEKANVTIQDRFLKVDSILPTGTHAYNDVSLYTQEYSNRFGRLPKHTLKVPDNFNPSDRYNSSSVCYVKEGCEMTYTLCAYCNPFKNCGQVSMFKKPRNKHGSNEPLIDLGEPKFYNPAEYEQHLAEFHCISKYGTIEQPFTGFSLAKFTRTQEPESYKMCCICPYTQRVDEESACLAQFFLDHNKRDNSQFKVYLRHVYSHHLSSKKKTAVEAQYKLLTTIFNGKEVINLFVPFDINEFYKALNVLWSSHFDEVGAPILVEDNESILNRAAKFVIRKSEDTFSVLSHDNNSENSKESNGNCPQSSRKRPSSTFSDTSLETEEKDDVEHSHKLIKVNTTLKTAQNTNTNEALPNIDTDYFPIGNTDINPAFDIGDLSRIINGTEQFILQDYDFSN